MKNKIIIISIIVFMVVSFIIWNNRVFSTITLDINPSIMINLNRNNKVISIKAINDDAKEIVKDIKSKTIDNVIKEIVDKVVKANIIKDDYTVVLINTDGKIDREELTSLIESNFSSYNIAFNIITIDNITKEDEKLAKEYNITNAKASYINNILKENDNIDVKNLVNKSINEIKETKETGKYCSSEYTLEGDFCIKEIGKEKAVNGMVCENGYYEYNGKCYKETGVMDSDELECNENFELVNNKCEGIEIVDAKANFTCEKGELIKRGFASYQKFRDSGNHDQYVCEDREGASEPTLRCLLINHTMIDGKCADGPKPMLPTPTGCEAGDYLINGGCYTLDNGDQYVCPDGSIYEKSKGTYMELCPDTFNYTIASGSYSCSEGYTLEGSMCTRKKVETARKKTICPSNYTLVDYGRCINMNEERDLIEGYKCDKENSRVINDTCIILDIIEAYN